MRLNMKAFRFLAYTSIILNRISIFQDKRCFTFPEADYKSYIYYVGAVDLISAFYEKKEIYSLKILSICSISFIVIYFIVH